MTLRTAVSTGWQEESLKKKDFRENNEEQLKPESTNCTLIFATMRSKEVGASGGRGQGGLFSFSFRMEYIIVWK